MLRGLLLGQRKPCFQNERLGFAIGDVHGRADLLDGLITRVEQDAVANATAPPVFVLSGDYIDRGPDSAAVIDRLMHWRPLGVKPVLLMGNHEQMMLAFLDNPAVGPDWMRMGGGRTLASFDIRPPQTGRREDYEEASQVLRWRLGPARERFLRSLRRYAIFGDYFFVHAGVNPDLALEEQRDSDLFWIRDPFLQSRKRLSHVVVHGHTPVKTPAIIGRRIALDTAAYATGLLAAARFDGTGISFIGSASRGGGRSYTFGLN